MQSFILNKLKCFNILPYNIIIVFFLITLESRGSVIPLIVKSLKNPRSAVCKTAIMTSADIFKVYGDVIIDSVDPLVCPTHFFLNFIRSLGTHMELTNVL